MLIENKTSILKQGRIILPLLIIVELVYFILSLIDTPRLLRAIFVLPSLFIIPGVIILSVLKRRIDDIVKLTVESFFVSTLLTTLSSCIMLTLNLPLTPLSYSLESLIVTLTLSIIALIRRIEFKLSRSDILLVSIAFSAYIALLIYFSRLPRLFTPDETSYIFIARMGVLNGTVPPMGVRPDGSEIVAFFQGRYFWTYLLASFMGSTGLPSYQLGLLNVSFLVMTAIASSLLIGNKWLRIAVSTLVIFNPLLFSFSALALNDLTISFYTIFILVFFIDSFSKTDNNVSISIKNLLYSLLGLIVLTITKPNLLSFVIIWIILVYIMVRYRIYKQSWKYRALLSTVATPVLIYELCIDIPYVICHWILRSQKLASAFGKFLFISPTESIAELFVAPWWNPSAQTLFTRSFLNYLDYFYRILMPESSSLLISAIILALPILILPQNMRKDLDKTVFVLFVLFSLYLFYFDALVATDLSDAVRYSLWMIPVWIPLAIKVLKDMMDNPSLRKFLSISVAALILLWINIRLSRDKGGIYTGYALPSRLWTSDAIMIQLILLMMILSAFLLVRNMPKNRLIISMKRTFISKTVNPKNAIFYLAIILILSNEVYFSSLFMSSELYEDHSFNVINNALNNVSNNGCLVFTNNYIYMRPYISDKLLKQGLLLPFPDTKDGFLKLLQVVPNNTLFLISDDSATTWHSAGNEYIRSYADSNIILPELNFSELSRFDLPKPILKLTFDDKNEITLMDHSGFGNDGINYGAKIVDGKYGYALSFDGVDDYVRIPHSLSLHGDVISVGAWIKTNVSQNSGIVTKYMARNSGEYLLGVTSTGIRFTVVIGGKSVDYQPSFNYYDGKWHHLLGVYDGSYLKIYVDGVQLPNPVAQTGKIDSTTYDVIIGSGHSTTGYFFNGIIDEVQISDNPFSIEEFIKSYYKYYATEVCEIPLSVGQTKAKLFRTVNEKIVQEKSEVYIKSFNIFIDENKTVTVSLEIESNTIKEVDILLATDRFAKVYTIYLNAGTNNLIFKYPFDRDPSWLNYYWSRFNLLRVIVFENNEIVYNRFTSIWNIKFMNLLLLLVTIGVMICIILINLIM